MTAVQLLILLAVALGIVAVATVRRWRNDIRDRRAQRRVRLNICRATGTWR